MDTVAGLIQLAVIALPFIPAICGIVWLKLNLR